MAASPTWAKGSTGVWRRELFGVEHYLAGLSVLCDGQQDLEVCAAFTSSLAAAELEQRLPKAWEATLNRYPHFASRIVHEPTDDSPIHCVLECPVDKINERAQESAQVHRSLSDAKQAIKEMHKELTSRRTEGVEVHLVNASNGCALFLSAAHAYYDIFGGILVLNQLLRFLVDESHQEQRLDNVADRLTPPVPDALPPPPVSLAEDVQKFMGEMLGPLPQQMPTTPMITPDFSDGKGNGSATIACRTLDRETSSKLLGGFKANGVTITSTFDAALRLVIAQRAGRPEKGWKGVVSTNFPGVSSLRPFMKPELKQDYAGLAVGALPAAMDLSGLDDKGAEDVLLAGAKQIKTDYDRIMSNPCTAYGLGTLVTLMNIEKALPPPQPAYISILSSVGNLDEVLVGEVKGSAQQTIVVDDFSVSLRMHEYFGPAFHLWAFKGEIKLQFAHPHVYEYVADEILDRTIQLVQSVFS